MTRFDSRFAIVTGCLLQMLVGLSAGCCKEKPVLPQVLTWKQCITPDHGDPQGNGTKLLGVGLPIEVSGKRQFLTIEKIHAAGIANIDGNSIVSVAVKNHELIGKLPNGIIVAGRAWEGAALVGEVRCLFNSKVTFPVVLHIVSVATTDARIVDLAGTHPSSQFSLEIINPDNGKPQDACVKLERGLSENIAFPVSGYWNRRGEYIESPDGENIHFACKDHVVAKCLMSHYPLFGGDSSSKELFKACTRMMTADYCGTGFPLTEDGTLVMLRDTKNLSEQARPSEASELRFEAAWTGSKVVCIDHMLSLIHI